MRALFVKLVGLSLSLCCVVLAGCGDATPEPGNSTSSGSASTGTGMAATFDCAGTACEVGTHYCLESYLNNVHDEARCVALPASCVDCDCASSDAPKQYPTTNNCSNTVSCSQTDAAISVRCDQHL